MELTYQTNVPIGSKLMILTRSGDLEASSVSGEQGTDNPCVIDYLEFATNSYDKVKILIESPNEAIPVLLHSGLFKDGDRLASSIRPDNIVNHASGMWDVLEYNRTTNVYKFRLRMPLYFPKGVLLSVENTDSLTQKAGFYALVRYL